MKKRILLFTALLTLCLTACGGNKPTEQPSEPDTPVEPSQPDTPNDQPPAVTEYTIDFDLSGGTSSSYNGPVKVTSFTRSVFFFDCAKEGWTFRGWSYNDTKIFDEKGNLLVTPTMSDNMLFVALYSQTAKLTISPNIKGAGTITGEGEYPYNTSVDISAHPQEGYEFLGWYYQNTLLSSSENYKYVLSTSDVVIEARFKAFSYLMKVYSNNTESGYAGLMSNSDGQYHLEYEEYFDYKSTIRVAAFHLTPTGGTRFLGWYDSDNNLVSSFESYTFKMPNHDYTLECKWNYFTISYDLNEGTNNSNNPTSYTVESETLTLYTPTRTGYDFAGWTYNGNVVTEIDPSWIDNITLVANWTLTKNNLSISSDDASRGSATITSGSGYSFEQVTVTATPNDGYIFNGWYDGSTRVSNDLTYTFNMPANDLSLVAHFLTKEEVEKYATVPLVSDDGKTVTYGLYPQTNVNDPTLVAALNGLATPESNGWYLYEGAYYTSRVVNSKSVLFDSGTTTVSGSTYWFKCEPIVWDILSNDNGECYVISSVLLDWQRYNLYTHGMVFGQKIYDSNYKYSDIRAWLNSDFYNSAFALNTSYIRTTIVDNSEDTMLFSQLRDYSYACENTEDKVFLPSAKDCMYKLSTNKDRECKSTDWSTAIARYTKTCNCSYWTRSPHTYDGLCVLYVKYDGGLSDYSDWYHERTNYEMGIRPAITIQIP